MLSLYLQQNLVSNSTQTVTVWNEHDRALTLNTQTLPHLPPEFPPVIVVVGGLGPPVVGGLFPPVVGGLFPPVVGGRFPGVVGGLFPPVVGGLFPGVVGGLGGLDPGDPVIGGLDPPSSQ